MTVNYTTNLALGQPVTGTESGTWGDDVNNAVTSYLDIAIAGGLSVTVTTADVTLTLTQGTSSATNIGSTTAQYAILNVSGAMTAARNLILPSSSRQYVINNACTGGFLLTVKGSATTGVTLVNGEKAHVFWNGSDYAKLSNAPGGAGTFSSITNTGLTSGRVVFSTSGGLETDSAGLTFDGTNFATTGTATAAKLIPTGNSATGNGLYLPAANSVGLSTNGTNAVYIDSSQSVGIGTSSPTGKLDVRTAAGVVAQSNLYTGSNASVVKFNIGQIGAVDWDIGLNATAGNFYIGGLGGSMAEAYRITRTGTAIDFQTWNTGGSERMRIDSSGNVGIGTSSPSNKLQVTDASFATIRLKLTANANGTIWNDNASTTDFTCVDARAMTFGTSNTERMRIDSSGNLGMGTSSPQAKLQTSTAADGAQGIFSGAQSTNEQTLLFRNSYYTNNATAGVAAIGWIDSGSSGGSLTFKTGTNGGGVTNIPTERMRIDSIGNVGIGTTSPSNKLDIFTSTAGAFNARIYNSATTGNSYAQLQLQTDAGNFYIFKQNSTNATNSGAGSVSLYADGAYPMSFYTNSTERMRIDSSGNVGIGSTSPASAASRTLTLQNGGADGTVSITAGDYSSSASMIPMVQTLGNRYDGNQTFGGRFAASFRRSDGTAIASGASLGYYGFGGQWGTDTSYQSAKLLYAASIIGVAEGSFTSATAMPTAIVFATGSTGNLIQAPNVAYGTERMRIDSSGNVGIGTTAPGAKLEVSSTAPTIKVTATSGQAIFSVQSSGTNASYLIFNSGGTETARLTAFSGGVLGFNYGASATEAMRIDSSGNVLVTSAAGLGYGTGSGGTVTQATSKSTAVTLNKPTGQITMNNAALAGNTAVVFRLNDSLIASVDTVIYAASGNGNYEITTHAIFAGAVDIRVTNATVGSLSEALVINFSILKGATS